MIQRIPQEQSERVVQQIFENAVTQTHKFAVDTVNSARGHPASFLFVRFSSRGRIRWCCRCHRSASSIAQPRKSWVCWRHCVVRRGADGYCAVSPPGCCSRKMSALTEANNLHSCDEGCLLRPSKKTEDSLRMCLEPVHSW